MTGSVRKSWEYCILSALYSLGMAGIDSFVVQRQLVLRPKHYNFFGLSLKTAESQTVEMQRRGRVKGCCQLTTAKSSRMRCCHSPDLLLLVVNA